MSIIRKATVNDSERILELIYELAVFEKEPDAVKITLSDIRNDGFGDNPKFTCFVIEVKNKVEGMALVYPRYSTWNGEVIHLEDLIVSEKYRGTGLGTKLLDAVVKYGKEIGVRRISWVVLDWNAPAIKFYEDKGANIMRDWYIVQLDENGIDNYLKNI